MIEAILTERIKIELFPFLNLKTSNDSAFTNIWSVFNVDRNSSDFESGDLTRDSAGDAYLMKIIVKAA